MTSRPSDEARRALRAARERAPRDPDTAAASRPAPPPSPSTGSTGQETRRPADVAREALRRAVSEHRGGARPGSDMGAVGEADAPADQQGMSRRRRRDPLSRDPMTGRRAGRAQAGRVRPMFPPTRRAGLPPHRRAP